MSCVAQVSFLLQGESMTAFSLWQAFRYAFKTLFTHLFFFIGSGLLSLFTFTFGASIIIMALAMVSGAHILGVEVAFAKLQEFAGMQIYLATPAQLAVVATGSAIMMLLFLLFGLGYQRAALSLYDTNTTRVTVIFSQWRLVLWALLGRIVYAVMVAVGLVLLVVPGVYLAVRYWFYPYALIDQQGDLVGAFKRSAAVVSGSWWLVFFFLILCNLLTTIGSLAYGIGLLIALPVVVLAEAYAYRKLAYVRDHTR